MDKLVATVHNRGEGEKEEKQNRPWIHDYSLSPDSLFQWIREIEQFMPQGLQLQ